jgi:hypothetical protein
MKYTTSIFAFLISSLFSYSQDYTTGIGLRGGPSNGLTVKHFISQKAALEGILSTRWGGFGLTGLYELNVPIKSVSRLNFYYGLGGHIGSYDGKRNGWFKDDKNHTIIGIDGIIGLEYNFKEIPFNIGVDYKPGFNLIGYSGYWGDEGALSIRYIF